MAAYAAAVTSTLRKASKIGEDIYMFHGQVDITNYNSTLAEITGITGKFRTTPTVVISGVSESGYLCHWDPTDESIKCFYPTIVHKHDFKVESSGSIGTNMEIGLSINTDEATMEGGTGITAARTMGTNTPIQNLANSAAVEVANDVDVGLVYFIATGLG